MRVFQERQRFDQWWVWLLFLVCFGLLFIGPILKIKAGESPSLQILDMGFWIGFVVMVLVMLLFRMLVLETEIDEIGISYQFYPFHSTPKRIDWNTLDNCHTRKYKPISEYGGWGLRMGTKGGAYNVKGDQGIQMNFKNGKKLLIGTQKPEKAQEVINRYFKN